ncbi:hypothetical protein GCM10022206_57880 [Streptomyces chiangmaiensis]
MRAHSTRASPGSGTERDADRPRPLTSARLFDFEVIEHATRHIPILVATAHPIAQRNTVTGLKVGPGHHHQLRTRDKDRDRKVEALISVSSVVVSETGRGGGVDLDRESARAPVGGG